MSEQTQAVVVAPPGRMRDALLAMLKTIPQIELLQPVDDLAAAVKQLAPHAPGLILLDAGPSGPELDAVLAQLRSRLQTRYLALVSTTDQRKTMIASGADGVLLKGFSALELHSVLRRILDVDGQRPQPASHV